MSDALSKIYAPKFDKILWGDRHIFGCTNNRQEKIMFGLGPLPNDQSGLQNENDILKGSTKISKYVDDRDIACIYFSRYSKHII